MKIFIAGPLFSQAEREFNAKLDELLRKNGFETILPQRDIGEVWKTDINYRKIYEMDLRAIEEADVVVAVLDGPDVDSGTAFEIGYATAKGKPVVGLKTDIRTFAQMEEVNNMILQSVRKIVKDFESLLIVLKEIREAGEDSLFPSR
ncbi:MAG: nucleoside 2-deoxyribosyltransferase [Candidatus Hadarchaeales archaeon]